MLLDTIVEFDQVENPSSSNSHKGLILMRTLWVYTEILTSLFHGETHNKSLNHILSEGLVHHYQAEYGDV